MTDLRAFVPRLSLTWPSRSERFRLVDGTLVFADVSGFTKMTERLSRKGKVGAEEVADVINATFTVLLREAYRVDGSLLKFGGDALLLLFDGDDHARRAAWAAHRMRAALRALGPPTTSAGRVTLRMSVGMQSGPIHVFLVGDRHRELIVTGPVATSTAEMEAAANAGDILVGDATAASLDAELGAPKGPGTLLRRAPAVDVRDEPPAAVRGGKHVETLLPTALRAYLATGGDDAEHRQVTIAFLHFGGVDASLAADGIERTAERLDGVVSLVQATSEDHGVTFLSSDVAPDGGKIILTAGTPVTTDNDDERMLRTVRAIADGGPALPLRVGVHRGYVFAGAIGPSYRRSYTIMGDAVNTAARVMSRAAHGEILVTDDVLGRSDTVFRTEALPPFHVKGKRQPLNASVLGPPTGTKERGSRRLPLIGRDAELRALLDAVGRVRRGEGGLAAVVADAGLGKSRLLEEVVAQVDDARVLVVTCERYESATPYHAVRAALRTVTGIAPDATEEDLAAALGPRFRPWLPLLGFVLDVRCEPTPQVQRLDPRFVRQRLHETVRDVLDVRLDGTPLLWAFDDAQWMDEPSAALASHLAASARQRPWVLCVARRPGDDGFEVPQDAERITLGPLSTDDATALARAATGDALLPARARTVAERSGGHPMFVQELAEAVRAAPDDVDALPSSVEAAIAARIDRLRPDDRRLLRELAVSGEGVAVDVLREVVETPERLERPRTWTRLREFGDLADGIFRFRQSLIQEVAYAGLPYRRRRTLHARLGERLEEQGAEVEILSLHFHRAQSYDASWVYSREAARRAEEKYAPLEAATFHRRAVEAGRNLPTLPGEDLAGAWQALGETQSQLGMYDDAMRSYARARRAATDAPALLPRLFFLEGRAREAKGALTAAVRWYVRGLRCEGPAAAAVVDRVRLQEAMGAVRFNQGKLREAVAIFTEAFEAAERAGDVAGMGHAANYLLLCAMETRDDDPVRWGEIALRCFEEIGHRTLQAQVLNNLGIQAYYAGRWDDALRLYERSRIALEEAGAAASAAVVQCNIGEILSDQRRYAEAEPLFRDAFSTLRAAGSRHRYLALGLLGRLAALTRRFEEADAALAETRDAYERMGASALAAETDVRIAEGLLLRGDDREALRVLSRVGDRVPRSTLPLFHRLRGRALDLIGDPAGARDAYEESLRIARRDHARYEEALGLEALASLGHEQHDALAHEAASMLRGLGVAEPAVSGT